MGSLVGLGAVGGGAEVSYACGCLCPHVLMHFGIRVHREPAGVARPVRRDGLPLCGTLSLCLSVSLLALGVGVG